MGKIKFSIIIPLYNKEKYIGKTIDSIISQSYENFEILIVNDGSTDSSLDIVKQYSDNRIRIVDKKNEGVSATRNRGMLEASGDYVGFLDADDVLLPNALNEFLRMIEEKECDIYAASFIERDINGNIVKKSICSSGLFNDAMKAICFYKVFARMGNIMIKRSILSVVGQMRTDITLYEDLEWILRLLRGRSIYASNSVVMEYLRDGNGISHVFYPIEKDLVGRIYLGEVDNKYERIILSDFLFRRLVRRLQKKDYCGLKKILNNNICFLHIAFFSTFFRIYQYKKINNSSIWT